MDSKSIRYQNTRLLVDSVGGVSNFAEKIGKGQSQTSQFAGTNPIKGIGNKVAREIEEAFGKPYGWLDVAHTELWDKNITDNLNISDNTLLALSPRSQLLDQLIKKLELLDQTQNLTEEEIKLLQHTVDVLSKSKNTNNDKVNDKLSRFKE
ncbi:hypothetical protein [Acinetobacter puyangensis]|uniref:hypothetical protein n=1 Tax=Acinetobacter puyangensis TaxID=1096779 RepID=UPI003A4DC91A